MAAETVEADDAEVPEKSIREELEAARDEVIARQENADGNRDESVREVGRDAGRGDGHSQEVSGAGDRPVGSGASGTGERIRGPDGKFAPRDSTLEQTPQPASTPAVALPAPTAWKAEEKALWAKVPPEVQHVINRREQDIHRTVAAQDEIRLIGNQFVQTANEYSPVLNARGITPVAFFKEALGIVTQLGSPDPNVRAQMLRQLAHANGIDPRVLIGQQPGASGQQPPNIPIDQLIQRQINEAFQARQRQESEARERAEMQATNSEIEVFRSKLDAQGQPAYPYFDHVTSLMASILGEGAASTLEEAYQLAVKAHPETSVLITRAEQAKAKQAEEKRRQAEAKRRAGGSIRGSVGGATSTNGSGKSIRDELKSAFEEARGRV